MAQLVHFHKDSGPGIVEYVVIDDSDLDPAKLEEEYGEPGFELGDIVAIDGDVTSFPTDRALTSSW